MKEFYSTVGGRHLYSSDLKNIEENALAAAEIFRECGGNFVISGCIVDEEAGKIGQGYVYINGKVRKVLETLYTVGSDLYIVALERAGGSIRYADGTDKSQYIEYYAEVQSGEVSVDQYIQYNATTKRFPNLADVFFNSYTLVKNGMAQIVESVTTFLKTLQAHGINNLSEDNNKSCRYYVNSDGVVCADIMNRDLKVGTIKFDGNGNLTVENGSGTIKWSIGGNENTVFINNANIDNLNSNAIESQTISANTQINSPLYIGERINVSGRATANSLEIGTGTSKVLVSNGKVDSPKVETDELGVSGVARLNAPYAYTEALNIGRGYVTGLRVKTILVNDGGSIQLDKEVGCCIITSNEDKIIYLPDNCEIGHRITIIQAHSKRVCDQLAVISDTAPYIKWAVATTSSSDQMIMERKILAMDSFNDRSIELIFDSTNWWIINYDKATVS